MALVSSLFTAITGMRNHQTMLDVISNNVANVNTVGFKAGRVQFRDLLSQTVAGASGSDTTNNRGGTNPVQFGTGVAVASIDTSFRQGTLQATGNATDLAINGDGFFITQTGNTQLYTRAGSFRFDSMGRLVDPSGGLIQGWSASIDPNDPLSGLTLDTSNAANIGNITINAGMTLPPQETRNIEMVGNLDAGATWQNLQNSSGVEGTADITVTDAAAVTTTYTVGEHQMTFNVYDSLGQAHELTATLRNISGTQIPSAATGTTYDNNTWSWTIDTNPNDTSVHLALDNTFYDDPDNAGQYLRASSSGIMHYNTNGSLDYVLYSDRNGEHFGTDQNTLLPVDPNSPTGWTALADASTTDGSIIGIEGSQVITPASVDFNNPQAFDLKDLRLMLVYQNVPAGMVTPPGANTAGSLQTLTIPPAAAVTGVAVAGNVAAPENWYVQAIDIDWGTVSTFTPTVPATILADFGPAGAALEDPNGPDFPGDLSAGFFVNSNRDGLRDGLTQDVTGAFDADGIIYRPQFDAYMRNQDGYAQGILQGVSVDASGRIVGTFTNGQSEALAQIAIATFENPAGLAKVGETHFTTTANSGNAIVGEALQGGRGSVIGGVVEQSNVDLSEELTNMIVAQRGFEVNARLITTSDRILDTLVNLGR
jgi:flagellar hook protein FlgE